MFSALDYATLYDIVFQPDYPGYKPDVVESPNGDGVKDTLKRYAHVAMKHLSEYDIKPINKNKVVTLQDYLLKAHDKSIELAITIGVPRQYWPSLDQGCLRILEYGPYASSAEHTDMDLISVSCYRNLPEYFEYVDAGWKGAECKSWEETRQLYGKYLEYEEQRKMLKRGQEVNKQVHFGELLEEVNPKIYKANKHQVVASKGPTQFSAVYFAVPAEDAVLPSGISVGKWLDERKKRSRYEQS